MITSRPWFGPKKYIGWGWTAVAWQGWAVVMVFIGASLGFYLYLGVTASFALAEFLCVVALLGVCILTGTKPGGPRSG